MTALDDLPEDVLLLLLAHLSTARDIAHLSMLSRRWHRLIKHKGWRSFVKNCFSSLALPGTATLPSSNSSDWVLVAKRLTRLDRCWERRSFHASTILESPRGGRRAGRPEQSVPFQGIVAAGLLPGTTKQLIAIGAGQNVCGLFTTTWKQEAMVEPSSFVWDELKELPGQESGYAAGMGDVTALTVLERAAKAHVAVGRANGDVHLLSGDEASFGKKIASLSMKMPSRREEDEPSDVATAMSMLSVSSDGAVSSLDWQARTQALLTGTKTGLCLHSLAGDLGEVIEPRASHDLGIAGRAKSPTFSFLHAAKFINPTTVACGLANSMEPLRWVRVTESDFLDMHPGGSQDALSEGTQKKPTTVRAIEPVGALSVATGNENLALSAWEDGTVRLWDIRTSSPADLIYQDDFNPTEALSSLLIYGSTRFVAGTKSKVAFKIFDFRWPKPYLHAAALACGADVPTPPPPYLQQPSSSIPTPFGDPSLCNYQKGIRCRWHHLMGRPEYRPNCTLLISPRPTRHQNARPEPVVYSLAKASDVTDTFYAGVAGSVMEVVVTDERPPSRAPFDIVSGGRWKVQSEVVAVLETGDGLGSSGQASAIVPPVRHLAKGRKGLPMGARRSRIDGRLVVDGRPDA